MAEELGLEIRLTPASKKALEKLRKLLTPSGFRNALRPFFALHAPKAGGHIVRTMLSGQRLSRRTGRLAGSVLGLMEDYKGLPAIRVGTLRGPATKYGGIQQRGGEIRPVKAKALAIPQEAALTPAGVDRFGGPRGYPGELKFIPFRNSGVAVGGLYDPATIQKGEDGKVDLASATMYYMLVKRVNIPASKWLTDGWKKYSPTFTHELAVFLKDLVQRLESPNEGKKSR